MTDITKTILMDVDGTVLTQECAPPTDTPVLTLYDYSTPLDPEKQEIRLLILLPLEISGDRVSCLMTKASLKDDRDTLKYTALSYTWGDPNDRCPIMLNFREIQVTRNLEAALRHLRDERKLLQLWVDALCINQADDAEKGHQVRHMTEIYAKSNHTRIWLGEEFENSNIAMDFIDQLQPNIFEDPNVLVSRAVWPALESLMTRPWWSRVWVLQEALMSTEPVFMCGKKEVNFERFVEFEKFRFENRERQGISFAPLNSLREINPFLHFMLTYDKTRDKLNRGAAPLYEWVIGATKFAATERRDKIYALLGLSTQYERNRILPDYQRSLRDLLKLVTIHFLWLHKRLFVLQYRNQKSEDLPSWVPDYTVPRQVDFTLDEHVGNITYLASQNSQCLPLFSDDFESLILLGIAVDTIKSVSLNPRPTPEEAELARKDLDKAFPLCHDWEISALQPCAIDPYEASCGRREAFWRTLIHDRRFDGSNPPPSDFGLRFEVWMGRAQMPAEVGKAQEDKDRWLRSFWFPARCRCISAAFILTNKGFMGTAPEDVEVGDIVCLLRGGDVPFVLRKKEDYYVFVGECYVHGIMDGSAWQEVKPEEHVWFELR